MKTFMIVALVLVSSLVVSALEDSPELKIKEKGELQPQEQADVQVAGQTREKRTLGLIAGAILGAKAGAVTGALAASAFHGNSYRSGRYYGGDDYANNWGYVGNYANNWGYYGRSYYNNYYNDYPRYYRTYPVRAYAIESWKK